MHLIWGRRTNLNLKMFQSPHGFHSRQYKSWDHQNRPDKYQQTAIIRSFCSDGLSFVKVVGCMSPEVSMALKGTCSPRPREGLTNCLSLGKHVIYYMWLTQLADPKGGPAPPPPDLEAPVIQFRVPAYNLRDKQ